MDFFTQKLCNEYAKKINNGEVSDTITIRCKRDFGKTGVCIQYTGKKKPKYNKFKSCRKKDTKQKDIVSTGIEENVMCDSAEDYLFSYLQETLYPWKDDNQDKIFSDEYTKDTPNYIDYVIIYQQNNFCGIMVIEMNECNKKKPDNLYSIRLICAQKVGKKSAAMQLLGLYLYILKLRFPNQQYGFLELAGGFRNVIGYCLYSKLNFKTDPAFDCKEYEINNLSNLKMRVKMDSIDTKTLIEKVRKNDWYDSDALKENEMICKRCDDVACETDRQKILMQMQTEYEADIPDAKKKDKQNNYVSWKENENLFSMWIDLFDKLTITSPPPTKKTSKKKTSTKKTPTKKKGLVKSKQLRRSNRLLSITTKA